MGISEWIITFYFSFGLFLSQLLRTYYIRRDPQYNGRYEVGFSFFHDKRDTVGYKYGYRTAVLLGIATFVIMVTIFHFSPELKLLSTDQFYHNYLPWIFVTLLAICCIADVFGPSLTKIILNGTLVLMTLLMFYLSLTNTSKPFWVITTFLITFGGLLIAIGYYWITSWVKDRVQKYGVIAIYRAPTIYYGGTLAYIGLIGLIGILVILNY